MGTVNIDGYHQMSLLYKVIQVAFLGEHIGDLKRHLGLSPHLPSGASPCPQKSKKRFYKGSSSKICSLAQTALKPVS